MREVRELTGHCWLVVCRKNMYGLSVPRVSLRAPTLKRGEKAIKVNLSLPDTLFSEPELLINVEIPPENVSAPAIQADLMENISETLKQQMGISATVQLLENDE